MTVVVRFAPSPTGYLHVGGLRTALYNYLFARKHHGRFILRIEDTDQSRYVEGAVENLMKSLRAMGLDWDAGPDKNDEKGPYFQSQRLSIYQKQITRLLETGKAYRCFCPHERLEALRKKQLTAGQAPGYDGVCRNLDPSEAEKRAHTESHVIRMRIPDEGSITFHDEIRGDVTVDFHRIDDQVLIKSDGFPTYHFANVVDDHLMGITHVIRGEEWLPSLPKHLLLYDSFGWEPPRFAHLPLLLNPDKSKLSKRQGDVAVEEYLAKGYLPQALNNFLALLGWNPGTDQEIFSMEELIDLFSLDRVNKAGAVFNVEKLNWMNQHYIQAMDETAYLKEAKKWISPHRLNERADIALLTVKNSLVRFDELPEKLKPFVSEPTELTEGEGAELMKNETTPHVLQSLRETLIQHPLEKPEDFFALMKTVQKETGVKGKNLWMSVRLALTGEIHGPELGIIAYYLGKEEIIRRVESALRKM
ncbi:MAG: glutamate--tRNA ligase [Candidatus Marinimicrobia bacterium]|nr:glutamate--tRNA ligase [Candidatus Neomarinimicrobiota bacterium]MDD5582997.1 glutamate--tRNA ligase [Candidatus Neomarinimicrobiota bacterium]